MLAILASMAESESRSISENEKWSIKKRFQNGTYMISYLPYGYTNVDGEIVIVPEQAEVVKEIFAGCLAGKSTHIIAKELNEKGVATKKGGKWTGGTINGILTNEKYIGDALEKYMGDALLQKTYTVDVLTKKRVANNGIVPQYYVENNHEAIIPRQLFMQVQEELQRREHLRTEDGKTKRVYSSKYALSSIIYCGKCGDLFRRVAWKARGASYNKWRCAS